MISSAYSAGAQHICGAWRGLVVSPTLALNGEKNRDLAQEAGIPDGYTLQCGVIIGYVASENKFSVAERTKKGSVNIID